MSNLHRCEDKSMASACENCLKLQAALAAHAREQVEAFREQIITWLDNEDKDGDPDDLYTGRVHRVHAIRQLTP